MRNDALDRTRLERAQASVTLLNGALQLVTLRAEEESLRHDKISATIRARSGSTELLARVAQLERELEQKNRIIAELERTRDIDALTGTMNRNGFDRHYPQEWNRCSNGQQEIALIFIDLDRFKTINDTYDHSIGDAALTAAGTQIIRSMRRAGEIAARFGGDEFVVVLPNGTISDAAILSERIRIGIASLDLPFGEKHISFTASVGFASAFPHLGGGPQSLVQVADAAVKLAKEQGGNASVTIEQSTGEPLVVETTSLQAGASRRATHGARGR